MPQLDVSTYTSQLFWLVICFFTLYFVLKNKIIPELNKIFQNRWTSIEGAQEKAKELQKKVQQIKIKCASSLKKSRELAKNITDESIRDSRTKIKNERNKILEISKKNINNFKKKIKEEEKKSDNFIKQEIHSLVINSIIKISRGTIDKKIIEKTVNEKNY